MNSRSDLMNVTAIGVLPLLRMRPPREVTPHVGQAYSKHKYSKHNTYGLAGNGLRSGRGIGMKGELRLAPFISQARAAELIQLSSTASIELHGALARL